MSRTFLCVVFSAALLLLAAPGLAAPADKPAKSKDAPKKAAPQEDSAGESTTSEEAIQEALAAKSECEFIETPLQDVVDFFRSQHKINILIDKRGLDDVGIGSDTPITMKISGVSFRSTLELMLRELDLTWTIHNEVLLITTPEEAESMLVTKVYPVGDLVAGGEAKEADCGQYDYDALVDLISASISPSTWDDVGGPGSISVAPFGRINAVVISQTYQVHLQVDKLLEDLRKVAAESGKKQPAKAAK